MKTKILLLALMALPVTASAQYAFDALQYSQTQLRGTSRFISMGGAFGALGGDISTLGQNPGGIGVYRSSDINVSGDLDLLSSEVTGNKSTTNKFLFSNVGYVGAFKLNSESMPNFNIGFSYNRVNAGRRHYSGGMVNIPTSVTNYFAEKAMQDNVVKGDFETKPGFNPYWNGNARWDQIAAYRTYLINPDASGKKFEGLGYDGCFGENEFEVDEWGHTDEYNFTFGGNIKNKFYWGLTLGFTDLVYESYKYYGELLTNTVVYDQADLNKATRVDGNAALGIVNESRTVGTGFNAKLGFIFRPVNALRIGAAVHTPTYFDMKDVYSGNISSEFYGDDVKGDGYSLEEYYPSNEVFYKLKTPWKFIGSVATVVGGKGILSADYEYTGNETMRICDDRDNEYYDATSEIKTYMQPSHTIRVGAEYRVSNNVSLRAGYSYQTSPTQDVVVNDEVDVEVAGTNPSYSYDKSNQHITAGIGYHSGSFYFDMAYVNQMRKSNYHAFSGIVDLPTVSTEIKDNNHRIQATMGFRF